MELIIPCIKKSLSKLNLFQKYLVTLLICLGILLAVLEMIGQNEERQEWL